MKKRTTITDQLTPDELKLARRAERAIRRLRRAPPNASTGRVRVNERGEYMVSSDPVNDYFLKHPDEARALTKLRRLQLKARTEKERKAMAKQKTIPDQLTPEELKLARRAERALRRLPYVPSDAALGRVRVNERGERMVAHDSIDAYFFKHPDEARALTKLRRLQLEARRQREERRKRVTS